MLNQKCIRDHKISFDMSRRHSVKDKAVSPERFVRLGDVLVNSTGTGTLGRVAQVREEPDEPTTVDSHVTIVRPRSGMFHLDFFGYMLVVIEEAIKEAGEGCGGQTELARCVLADRFSVNYPTAIPEQQRIVGILDEAFEGIATATANAEKNLQNARALFESYLESIFTTRGESWVKTTLERVLCEQPRNGWSPPAANHSDSGVPVLTLSAVTGFKFRADKVKFTSAKPDPHRHYWVKNGDFLITRSNTPELVGHVAIASGITEPTIYPDLIMRMNTAPDRMLTEFLYYQLRTPSLRQEIAGRAHGANPTMKKISKRAVQSLPIHVPPLPLQKKITIQLDALTAETQRLESIYQQKIAALSELKKSLLHQAFTGQLTADSIAVSAPTPICSPTELEGISTTDLHAGILALSHQFHEKAGKLEHFGHVKAEKIAHMIEACLGIDLGRKPIKDAAGPNDFPHLHKVEYRARMANFFDFKRVERASYRVHKLRSFDRLIDKTRAALGSRANEVDGLLELMLPMQTQQAEIFCTVYAAWNNLLLDGKQPTDEQIVFEARENWHPDKLKISRERFFSTIEWIRNKSLIPPGKGKKVCSRVE